MTAPLQLSEIDRSQNYGSIESANGKKILVPTSNIAGISCDDKIVSGKERGASSLSTSFNIFKSIVGSSILCMPWAVAGCGFIPAFILTVICAILSFICWMFLVQCSDELNLYQFRDVALNLFGNKFALLVDLNFIVMSVIYSILYGVLLGEFIGNGLSEFGINIDQSIGFNNCVNSRFFIITVIILVVCGPLTLAPKLDYLQYSSIIGITGTLITVVYIDYTFFTSHTVNDNVSWVNTHNHSNNTIFFWLESFGAISATFFGHFNTCSLYNELNNKSVKKMKWITVITFIVIAIFLSFMAIPAYLSFGNDVHQNVIESLVITDKTKGIVASLRLLMALNIIGSYPLLFYQLKISMKHLVFFYWETNVNIERLVYFGINVLIWLIALYAQGVGELLSLVQAVSGNAILFVFPTMFYYALLKKQHLLNQKITVVCFGIVCFGLIAMIGGVISIVMNMTGYIQPQQ
eukprot:325956_1